MVKQLRDGVLISVVIPAFNEEKVIQQTLERIQFACNENKGKGFSWQIIVCDNNSTDKTAEIAAEMGAKVAFEPINQISRARNRGATIAQGDWLLFIDADSYPSPALVADMLGVIEGGHMIGCGATVVVEDGTLFNKLRLERLNPIFRLFNVCGGAFILCRAEAFRAVAGFSPSLYAYEDIDFVIRLKRYGRSHHKQFAVLHHHPVVTSGRKGEYGLFSMVTLFVSNIMGAILFLLHYLLPRKITARFGSRLLGYWYRNGR